jgi:alginate O-acetyltransferase complex protein AlgI
MLFNSLPFILLFLPAILALFYGCARLDHRLAAGILALASICFYGWWDSRYVLLLAGSIIGNFLLSDAILRNRGRPHLAGGLLAAAVGANLALLGYYKYAGFFVRTADALGAGFSVPQIVLPLGISFFTFTQIAFQVDTWRGIACERNFLHYFLFITYFPHLIAGPILHHAEMMPQFGKAQTFRFSPDRLAVGLTLFILGLVKKTVCADGIAPVAQAVFAAAESRQAIDLPHAWYGALAYAMQIYFDFSAYSDMALGISIMFGIRLPLNFNSPYKARSIIDFWRRWHMTLSRFLRDYLYIPLGGSRCPPTRRYANLMITMLLGGLWHGAGWTYVIWGGLHGVYLVVNHGWQGLRKRLALPGAGLIGQMLGLALTFCSVTLAWVFFRAETVDGALALLRGLAGANGLHGDSQPYVSNQHILSLVLLLGICWFLPNAYQLLGRSSPALQEVGPAPALQWNPDLAWALALAVLAALSLSQILSGAPSAFIYFQF